LVLVEPGGHIDDEAACLLGGRGVQVYLSGEPGESLADAGLLVGPEGEGADDLLEEERAVGGLALEGAADLLAPKAERLAREGLEAGGARLDAPIVDCPLGDDGIAVLRHQGAEANRRGLGEDAGEFIFERAAGAEGRETPGEDHGKADGVGRVARLAGGEEFEEEVVVALDEAVEDAGTVREDGIGAGAGNGIEAQQREGGLGGGHVEAADEAIGIAIDQRGPGLGDLGPAEVGGADGRGCGRGCGRRWRGTAKEHGQNDGDEGGSHAYRIVGAGTRGVAGRSRGIARALYAWRMTKQDLAAKIADACVLRGAFTLRSGRTSTYYLDKYLFSTRPEILRELGGLFAERVREVERATGKPVSRLAGAELGGIPLVTVASMATGLPCIFVRNAKKDYGTAKQMEGALKPGEAVVFVEDVATTGGQALEAVKVLRDAGADVLAVVATIDRQEGARENVEGAGLRFEALFTKTDLGVKE